MKLCWRAGGFLKKFFLEDKGAEGDPNHSSNATEPLDQYTVRVGGTGLPLIYQMEPFQKKNSLWFFQGDFSGKRPAVSQLRIFLCGSLEMWSSLRI